MPYETIADAKRAEAVYYDHIADLRTEDGHIPVEADYRRATRRYPKHPKDLAFDPQLAAIVDQGMHDTFISHVAHRPGGRVLDICCGSGWLALELGRRGQRVDAYDLSPRAIALASRMLAENPFTEGFGSVDYHLKDVTEVDLGEHTYDAVSGWAAFHHIPDLPEFMKRVWRALKPGGILATMDDMPRGRIEKGLEYCTKFVLPLYSLSYARKIATATKRLTGVSAFPVEGSSPMEEDRHSTVFDIARIWYEQYDVIVEHRQNAFVSSPLMAMSGPDAFRYTTARALIALDNALCKLGVTKGFDRVLIARKPL